MKILLMKLAILPSIRFSPEDSKTDLFLVLFMLLIHLALWAGTVIVIFRIVISMRRISRSAAKGENQLYVLRKSPFYYILLIFLCALVSVVLINYIANGLDTWPGEGTKLFASFITSACIFAGLYSVYDLFVSRVVVCKEAITCYDRLRVTSVLRRNIEYMEWIKHRCCITLYTGKSVMLSSQAFIRLDTALMQYQKDFDIPSERKRRI